MPTTLLYGIAQQPAQGKDVGVAFSRTGLQLAEEASAYLLLAVHGYNNLIFEIKITLRVCPNIPTVYYSNKIWPCLVPKKL